MRRRTLYPAVLIALVVAAGLAVPQVLDTEMPGRSYAGALPPASAAEHELAGRLEAHVVMLADQIGERHLARYDALQDAANYLESTFRSFGFAPQSQVFEVQGKTVRNIEVEIPGSAPAAGIVVLGAHYDTARGSPGANDNATGVAALLELARLLRGRPLERSVRLVAFVNEEPPFFYSDAMGSVQYANRSAARGENIVAMLSLETMGYYDDAPGSQRYPFPLGYFYPDAGNFIGFVGNRRSRTLVRRVTASFREHARFPSEGLAAPSWLRGVSWSDHWAFWRAGYPAVMVTDTALYRYREYHTASDRPDIIEFDRLARVVAGLAQVVVELARPVEPRADGGGTRGKFRGQVSASVNSDATVADRSLVE